MSRRPYFAHVVLKMSAAILTLSVVAAIETVPAAAQQLKRTERHKDWSVFVNTRAASKYCYAATTPVKTTAKRGGRAVPSIKRDSPFLMVTTFPDRKAVNEVSVRVGYQLDKNKPPSLKVGNASFKMFSDGEDAWSEQPADDSKIVAAFRRGSDAVLTAVSTRGTVVTDTFSLRGFTDAVNSVQRLCK